MGKSVVSEWWVVWRFHGAAALFTGCGQTAHRAMWMRRARRMRTLRLVHAVDGVAARREVDLEELRTSVNKPDSPPPTRCHATDTTENCGGGVLHVISGIPLAAIIAWSGGTRRAISGQMPLVCLGGQICKRTLDLEKNVESDGFAELDVTISRQKAGD